VKGEGAGKEMVAAAGHEGPRRVANRRHPGPIGREAPSAPGIEEVQMQLEEQRNETGDQATTVANPGYRLRAP
jgi:hypothetical protein